MKKHKCVHCGVIIEFDEYGYAPLLCEECRICEGAHVISQVEDLKVAESKLCNCVLKPKIPLSETMFYSVPGVGIYCNLDGYAVVPAEEYTTLLARSKECLWCRLVAWFRR